MSFFEILYYLTIVYGGIILVIYIKELKNSANYGFIFLLCCNIVADIGYTWSTFAKTLPEALLGAKLNYLGGIFMCYIMFRIIASICKIRLNAVVKNIATIITVITVSLPFLFIGNGPYFYKNVDLVVGNSYSYLIKEYGPLHMIYLVVLYAYMLASLGAAVYALFTPTLVSRVMAVLLAMTDVFSIGVYLGERAAGIKMELLPFTNCVSITVAIICIRKVYLYDADRAVLRISEANHDNGVILFDMSRRYLGSNKVAKELFTEINNYYVEQVIPDSFSEKAFFKKLIDNFESGAKGNGSSDTLEKNGEIYRLRTRHLLKENNNEIIGYIIEIINDTQIQTYIRKISKMNSELEVAAAEAEAANTAKSSFLANMSHEIRTPINAVLGLNSIILRDTKEESTREYANDINNAGKSLLALINDILDFSKIEAGKMDVVPVEYELKTLINDCQNMMYSKILEKGLEFETKCSDTTPSVLYGDEVRIRQIIINLLSNAVKYTEKGLIELNISYRSDNQRELMLIVSVKDTGAGISEENQKHLFESFRRIDEVRNRNIEGTGLGLALVKNLVTLMNGNVSVKSELGKGSEFTVEIPQRIIDEKPVGIIDEKINKTGTAVTMDDLSETEGDILVVDDVRVNLKVFTKMLNKSKLNIVAAESGEHAIDYSRKKKFDIIFLDHMMPGMDGIETFHRLREDDDSLNRETPVVMLTANAIEGVREQYIDEGFDDYLSKPINYDPLKESIIRFLKGNR